MTLDLSVSGQKLLNHQERSKILKKIKEICVLIPEGSASLNFVLDSDIKALNKKWRRKNKITDVLSFSAQEGSKMPGLEGILGDVVISVEKAQEQAQVWGHGLQEEVVVLFVHGLMHLMGYNHERSEEESRRQIMVEMALLQSVEMDPKKALCGRYTKSIFKMTRPRELILSELIKSKEHLSAEEILEKVRKQDAQIGQATVYRTLKLLQDSNLVKAHYFRDKEALFEINLNPEEHHDHLICEMCGRIIEFQDFQIEDLQKRVAEQNGFKLNRHRMELYGVCSKCE